MSSLIFCRDGILRTRRGVYNRAEHKHYPILLPLSEMEARWPGMFLSLLEATVEFEDGLDVREGLLNLAPWSAEVSAITNCRFDLFLDEARKPLADGHFSDLDTLGFVYQQEIDAEPNFERDSTDMFQRIPGSRNYEMRESRPLVTDRIDLSGNWDCRGYKAGTEDFFDNARDNGVGLTLSPLNMWHHLKLKVVNHYWLLDRTVGSDHLTHRDGLLAQSHPLVEDVVSGQEYVFARRVRMQAPVATLYSVILKGLVWDLGFHGSPEETVKFADDLGERTMAEYDAVATGVQAQTDAEIEAEPAASAARQQTEFEAQPFEDEDIQTLEFVRETMDKNPNLEHWFDARNRLVASLRYRETFFGAFLQRGP